MAKYLSKVITTDEDFENFWTKDVPALEAEGYVFKSERRNEVNKLEDGTMHYTVIAEFEEPKGGLKPKKSDSKKKTLKQKVASKLLGVAKSVFGNTVKDKASKLKEVAKQGLDKVADTVVDVKDEAKESLDKAGDKVEKAVETHEGEKVVPADAAYVTEDGKVLRKISREVKQDAPVDAIGVAAKAAHPEVDLAEKRAGQPERLKP